MPQNDLCGIGTLVGLGRNLVMVVIIKIKI